MRTRKFQRSHSRSHGACCMRRHHAENNITLGDESLECTDVGGVGGSRTLPCCGAAISQSHHDRVALLRDDGYAMVCEREGQENVLRSLFC